MEPIQELHFRLILQYMYTGECILEDHESLLTLTRCAYYFGLEKLEIKCTEKVLNRLNTDNAFIMNAFLFAINSAERYKCTSIIFDNLYSIREDLLWSDPNVIYDLFSRLFVDENDLYSLRVALRHFNKNVGARHAFIMLMLWLTNRRNIFFINYRRLTTTEITFFTYLITFAKMFGENELEQICSNKLISIIDIENVCFIYEKCHWLKENNLQKKCFEMIKNNIVVLINNQTIYFLKKYDLKGILSSMDWKDDHGLTKSVLALIPKFTRMKVFSIVFHSTFNAAFKDIRSSKCDHSNARDVVECLKRLMQI